MLFGRGGGQSQILVKMTEPVFCSSDGDEGASRDFFRLIVEAEVTYNIVDMGELVAKVSLLVTVALKDGAASYHGGAGSGELWVSF
jgi:hypothetical protein